MGKLGFLCCNNQTKSTTRLRMSSVRSKVLACYKSLHRARLKTFAGDSAALESGRLRIREEFIKNKHETDLNKIEGLLTTGKDVEKMLRQTVVQGVYNTEKNRYELKVTEETILQDNAPLPPKK